MGADTTTSSYWLNWRVFLCCLWILTAMGMASYLITKYEGPLTRKSRNRADYDDDDDDNDDYGGVLYDDEVWKPCLKGIHPAWLMTYRIFAFIVLLILIILNAIVDGGSIFYYYTQWTFTLITIYFGIGSLLSIYGCCQHQNKVGALVVTGVRNKMKNNLQEVKLPICPMLQNMLAITLRIICILTKLLAFGAMFFRSCFSTKCS